MLLNTQQFEYGKAKLVILIQTYHPLGVKKLSTNSVLDKKLKGIRRTKYFESTTRTIYSTTTSVTTLNWELPHTKYFRVCTMAITDMCQVLVKVTLSEAHHPLANKNNFIIKNNFQEITNIVVFRYK